jgi:hypothetical protein
VGVAALLKVTISVPSSLISSARTPSGCGLKMVFLGVPVLTSHTTNMESSPVSAVTITSRFLLYVVADIWLHYFKGIMYMSLELSLQVVFVVENDSLVGDGNEDLLSGLIG